MGKKPFIASGREVRINSIREALSRNFWLLPACVPRSPNECWHHGKKCSSPGKVTLIKMSQASNKWKDIEKWQRSFYDFNILIKTRESNLIVFDWDKKNLPEDDWKEFHKTLPNTFEIRSGSGGIHVYLQNPGIDYHRDSLRLGIDLRGANTNHVLIGEGSLHPSGSLYTRLCNLPIATLPGNLEESIKREKIVSNEYSEAGTTFLEILFEECGRLLGNVEKKSNGINIQRVICPLSETHSSQVCEDDASSAVLSGKGINSQGVFNCFHQSHGGHGSIKSKEAIRLLRIENPQAYDNAMRRCNLIPKDISHLPKILTLQESEAELRKAIHNAKEGQVTAIRCTTGIGKTQEMINWIAQNPGTVDVFLPTHKLAEEVTQRLRDKGVSASHRKGVTADKTNSCHFPKIALGSQKLRLPMRTTFCLDCAFMKTCVAFKSTDGKADVSVMMHSILAEAVKTSTAQRIFIDELPALIDKTETNISSLTKVFDVVKSLGEEALNPYKYLVNLLLKAIPVLENKKYFTLREVLGIGLNPTQQAFLWSTDTQKTVDKIVANEILVPEELKNRLASKGKNFQDEFVVFAESYDLLRSIRRCAIYPDRPSIRIVDNKIYIQTVGEWLDVIREKSKTGITVMLMSATIHSNILKALIPDNLEILDNHTEDGDNVIREFIFEKKATRTTLCPGGAINHIQALKAADKIYDTLVKASVRNCLIVSFKPFIEWLKENDSKLKNLIDAGIIKLAYYGNIVGLDSYKELECVVTYGNPVGNLDVLVNEANILQVPESDYVKWVTDSELTQSLGRSRACRRKDKVRIFHIGREVPSSEITPQFYIL